jgi:hypothetical protein
MKMIWIEFELKDINGIVWKAIIDIAQIHHIQLSRDKCSIQVGKLGDIKLGDVELGLRCYDAFIAAFQGHTTGIDEIGYIRPLTNPDS